MIGDNINLPIMTTAVFKDGGGRRLASWARCRGYRGGHNLPTV